MRNIKILKMFKHKHVKEISFDDEKYKAVYDPNPKHGMKTILYGELGTYIGEFKGSLRYIGNNIFMQVDTIKYKFDRKRGEFEVSEAGNIITKYTIIVIKKNKIDIQQEITLPNLKFILLNDYNELYYKIHDNVLEIFRRDFLHDKIDKVSTIIIEKTKDSYVGILTHDVRKKPSARLLFGKILNGDGSMEN